jgi:hypothetical protein
VFGIDQFDLEFDVELIVEFDVALRAYSIPYSLTEGQYIPFCFAKLRSKKAPPPCEEAPT